MIHYQCRNCGAQMDPSPAGGFYCPYCGAKTFMSDQELRGNHEFRQRILSYYKSQNDAKESDYTSDRFFEVRGSVSYQLEGGEPLTIEYMDVTEYPGMKCYVARESVIYICDKERDADLFLEGLSRLVYPEADTKLARCFPVLKMSLSLNHGKALVLARKPHFYPVKILAPLESVHLAWVISRMENICCALEYSNLQHGGFSPAAVYVNPVTHEGMLYGDWRAVGSRRSNQDLRDLRQVAKGVAEDLSHPAELERFVTGRPSISAFDDFGAWDKVIEQGFGGHHFHTMKL